MLRREASSTDREPYKEGQMVWLRSKNIKTQRPSKKLDDKYFGPFPIDKVLGTNVLRLRLPSTMKIHPVFHVSLIKPYHESRIENRHQPPPPPVIVGGEEEWEVERIEDNKRF
jgi:hypothetical protein